MKKCIAILLVVIIFLCSCKPQNEAVKEDNKASVGMWLTFSELNTMLDSEKGFVTEVQNAVNLCNELNIQNIYIHVHSYCDSLFKSDYFPLIESAKKYDFDLFKYMLDTFHKAGVKVHAWLNPYRVLTSSIDIEKLDSNSPVYKWLYDDNPENDVNVCFANGIYLNPAETQVQKLILDGIKEIIQRYDVDGIHFDDYFYPTTEASFDEKSYQRYCDTTQKPLELPDWRRANVNTLISSCYNTIKYENEQILFSISPAASVEKNYNEFYADVKTWIKDGYVDVIIPQLYFGFKYRQREFAFEELLEEWENITGGNEKVSLLIGLASYKTGTQTENDGEEWVNEKDIIARQADICYRDFAVDGFVLFSYSSLISGEPLNISQKENLKNTIKKYPIVEEKIQ